MNETSSFLIENFGFVGVALIALATTVLSLAWYIYKLHKESRNDYKEAKMEWRDERKEFRQSLDKNTEAINRNVEATNHNATVVESLKILLDTLNK